MPQTMNAFGQPIGQALPDWRPPIHPTREAMTGRYCKLVPVNLEEHASDLFAANQSHSNDAMWTYLPQGPFASLDEYKMWMQTTCFSNDPLFFTIMNTESGKPVGLAAYLRITPAVGSIEVGHLAYSPLLQRTPAATEAMFLMMQRAFALGYRRYEWKCDSLNAPSRAAAQRLGFSYEGIFRQASVYKGRTRDTAWYSIIDSEWPALKRAFEVWLDAGNFDANGQQRVRLSDLTRPILKAVG